MFGLAVGMIILGMLIGAAVYYFKLRDGAKSGGGGGGFDRFGGSSRSGNATTVKGFDNPMHA